MQFISALFGGTQNTYLNAAFALGTVLVLIVLGAWLLKLLGRAGTGVGRGRATRLTVVDRATVDGKRQVVIIRRDNVEHLIMTGGPHDLVIESGMAAPEPPAPRRAGAAQPQPRPQAASATQVAPSADPENPVPRDVVDRLRDLARPAPLAPRPSLRRSPESVIPMPPSRRVDNSAGPQSDSAKTGRVEGISGQSAVGARNRFFRSVVPGDRT